MSTQRIAIVGGGISGMGLLHLLREHSEHEVTLLEPRDYLGGHANAVWVSQELVDTGFMVCNEKTYPNIMQLFTQLGIGLQPTTMAFACDDAQSGFSVSFAAIGRRVWYSLRRLPFILEVMYAQYRIRQDVRRDVVHANESVGEYCARRGVPERVRDYFIIPVVASVWSQMESRKALEMPARQIFEFMDNHQLLQSRQPQWYSIAGSSWSYVKQLQERYKDHVLLEAGVEEVVSHKGVKEVRYTQEDEQKKLEADIVVFACHSSDIPAICPKLDSKQLSLVQAVDYQDNMTVLHTDSSWMPRNKDEWGAWNFIRRTGDDRYVCTYWLNLLQNLDSVDDLFITLDPTEEIDSGAVIRRFEYAHPVFTTNSIQALQDLDQVQGRNNYYFAGAWTRHGFHEDGLWSAVQVFEKIEGYVPTGYSNK